MEETIEDINDIVLLLAIWGIEPILRDEIWQSYGYKKRPRKGHIWSKLFPKRFELDYWIKKEILTMGTIDVLNGIKNSNLSYDKKVLIGVGVIDQILAKTEHMLNKETFLQNVVSRFKSCSVCERSKFYEPFILEADEMSSQRAFARFLVGTITLLGTPPFTGELLMSREQITHIIERSTIKGKFRALLPEDKIQEYAEVIGQEVF